MCLRWGFPLGTLSATLDFLIPEAEGARTPTQSLRRFFHHSQRRTMLVYVLFSFYIPAWCPSLHLQKGLVHLFSQRTQWNRGGGLEILIDCEELVSQSTFYTCWRKKSCCCDQSSSKRRDGRAEESVGNGELQLLMQVHWQEGQEEFAGIRSCWKRYADVKKSAL